MTVSSVGCSCRPPSHHRSSTRGRLDLVRQQRVTFLFSDCDADPRMVTALGGTEDRRTKERWGFRPGSSTQTDGGGGGGLTGDLQRDASLLGPFGHAVVGLTAETNPMVFRPDSHHQHAVSHCLGVLGAPSYGHWFTVLDTEASLVTSAQLLPPPHVGPPASPSATAG